MHGRPRLSGETVGLRTRGRQPSYHLNADEFAHARFFFLEMDRGADWKVAVRQAKVDLPFQCELRLFFHSHSCPGAPIVT